ncbi:hypothetical protein [Thermofilum pendens]|uniref:Uncharacterized protein n=1 Tax=Thermofilum pendens (strain DSM 2475 / Hrk 5) TaxID=368408 RepID=A1RYN8_THEPD|nr:hypothetical protein [Thermofilum pendens]ABL78318.1 hypothetical protein Tpen_0917 [Thermofilum pendens Hrk 5]
MRRRSAQIVVAAVLVIGLVLMSILVTVYQAHSLFLRTRSPVVRELVAAITADFKRALAAMLAVATRAYFNYSEFSDLTERFSQYGVSMYNRHNFTVARMAAKTYLEYWRQSVTKAYAEYGVQVGYEVLRLDLSKELGRSRSVYNLMNGYWYLPTSGSYAYARLKLNVTNLGFYNWESDVFVGLTLTVYRKPVQVTPRNTTIIINVRYDGDIDYSTDPPRVTGNPYGRLLSKGWVRVYYPERDSQGRYTGEWRLAKITDVTYQGYGNYSVTFEPAVEVFQDPLTGEQYAPVMVVVSDERGIVVEGSAYSYLVFAIQRNTPDTLYYYDKDGKIQSLKRPSDISNEVYTLEMSSNLSLFWLGQKLAVDPQLKLPPFPYVPIKQIRVNATLDGTLRTLVERPIQYENWTTVQWHGIWVNVPVGLSDPQMDFVKGAKYNTRLVFQVKFPTTSVRKQVVALWWIDDLDAEPAAYPSSINYTYSSTHKDVWHPLYDVEFVDLEHQSSRGYDHVSYCGVAAFVLWDPDKDSALGPYNLHSFDVYGSYLGRYRPYGTWSVYYNYLRYSWIRAPIRIFAVLNTTLVGNVYDYSCNDVRSDYYDTLSIVQVVNGTRYIPVITYIYWKYSKSGYGYWMSTEMGKGIADYFLYLTAGFEGGLPNQTYKFSFDYVKSSPRGVLCRPDPGFLITHWSAVYSFGRALVLSQSGVQLLRSIGGNDARFCTTAYAPEGTRQGSIEYNFWPYSVYRSVGSGATLSFWTVILDYRAQGSGFLSVSSGDMWKNAYIYAPMFLEKYSPTVVKYP